MPPPPPPSASYLLKFDTDSEDEEDSMRQQQQQQQQKQQQKQQVLRQQQQNFLRRAMSGRPKVTPIASDDAAKNFKDIDRIPRQQISRKESDLSIRTASSEVSYEERIQSSTEAEKEKEEDHGMDEDDEDDDEKDAAATGNTTAASPSKRKRRRRRNRRKKKNAAATAATTAAETGADTKADISPNVSKKNVSFGIVSVRLYERTLSEDGGVPADGGWPLGITDSYVAMEDVVIDVFEDTKQARLQTRWKELKASNNKANNLLLQGPMPAVLETRPFDYKESWDDDGHSIKNPLFGPLRESERIKLLCNGEQDNHHSHQQQQSKKKKKSSQVNTRSRSGSFSSTRSRSNSIPAESPFDTNVIRHVRNELERLRDSRSKEGSTGCSCRKLSVYIPPPDSGKKAQHKRLSERRVKEELRKRNIKVDTSKTRAELEQYLHDIVEEEPCCWNSDDCACLRNGLNCQSDCCSCWHDSHQTKDRQAAAPKYKTTVLPAVIQKRCGNRNGMYAVDLDAIHEYRKQMLGGLCCQVSEKQEEEEKKE